MKKLIAAALILFFSVPLVAQTAPKEVAGGVKAPVTVRRDARSIPYIEAASDDDAYFAQGYVMASDRLWQMDLMRRVARGELAEYFGDRVLEEDKRWRRFGFSELADEGLAVLNPELRRAIENFSRGVNAYIATLTPETLPAEFKVLKAAPREWKPTDTIVIGKILADALSTTWRFDVAREAIAKLEPAKQKDLLQRVTAWDVILFGADRPETAVKGTQTLSDAEVDSLMDSVARDDRVREASLTRAGMFAEGLAASNNWVVSGKHTADGRPMLANDPHLQPQAPGIWYLVNISTPGMRVSGVTFPGVPGVVLGHNEHIAWGATNVGPDVQDLYREEFNDKGEYRLDGKWVPAVRKKHIIKVRKNQLSPETSDVEFEVEETRNGVVIPTPDGSRYALRWTARDPRNQEFEAFFLVNRAGNWEEFRRALGTYGGATQNFIYADVKGNIGWQTAGRIPIRRTGEGERVYDGATGEGDWVGMIPFDELPRLYNPKGGIIMTANQRTVGTEYKYQQMARDSAMPWRARRIHDLLKTGKKFSMDDFRDIQHDAYNYPVHFLARDVVSRGSASRETVELLKGWDGMMKADSRAALLANEMRNVIAAKLAAEHNSVPADIIREKLMYWFLSPSQEERARKWLPKGFVTVDDLVRAADAEARAGLAKRFGTDEAQWVWGRYWQSRFTHPLAAAPLIGAAWATPQVPIDGSGQSPNVGSSISMQLIASPGNWDATRHVIPLGQSGDPASPHWKDQFDAWRTGSPAVFPFSREAVEKQAGEALRFRPR